MAKTNNTSDPNSINIICAGTKINGDVTTDGDIRIDGNLQGNLQAKGKIVIGASGNIQGEIVCKNADIHGTIIGKINVSELLTLRQTCSFNGNLVTKQLAIEPGAIFNGTCQMQTSPTASNLYFGKEQDKKE